MLWCLVLLKSSAHAKHRLPLRSSLSLLMERKACSPAPFALPPSLGALAPDYLKLCLLTCLA